MPKIYNWNGNEYNADQVAAWAADEGLSFDQYLNTYTISEIDTKPQDTYYNWSGNNYTEQEVQELALDQGLQFEDFVTENNIGKVENVGWGHDAGKRTLDEMSVDYNAYRDLKKQKEDVSSSILSYEEFELQGEDTLVDILEDKYGDQFKVTVPNRPGMDAVNIESEVTGQDITVYTGSTSAPDFIDRNAPSFGMYDPYSQYVMLMNFMAKNSQQGANPTRAKVYETTGLTEDQNEVAPGFGGDYGMVKDEFISFEDYRNLPDEEKTTIGEGAVQFTQAPMTGEEILEQSNIIRNSIVNLLNEKTGGAVGSKLFSGEEGKAISDPSWYNIYHDKTAYTKDQLLEDAYEQLMIKSGSKGYKMSRDSFDELMSKDMFVNSINQAVKDNRETSININAAGFGYKGLSRNEFERDYNNLTNYYTNENPNTPNIISANTALEQAETKIIALQSQETLSTEDQENLTKAYKDYENAALILKKNGADLFVKDTWLDQTLLSDEEKAEVLRRQKNAKLTAQSQNDLNNSADIKSKTPQSKSVKDMYEKAVENEYQLLSIGNNYKIDFNVGGGSAINGVILDILKKRGENVSLVSGDMATTYSLQPGLNLGARGIMYLQDENGNRIDNTKISYNELMNSGFTYTQFEGAQDESMHYMTEDERVGFKDWQLEYYANKGEKQGFYEVGYLSTDPADMTAPYRNVNSISDVPGYLKDIAVEGATTVNRAFGTMWGDGIPSHIYNTAETARDRMNMIENTIGIINSSDDVKSGKVDAVNLSNAAKENLEVGYTEATVGAIGNFVPTLVEFALFEFATGGLGSPAAIAKLGAAIKAGKQVNTATRLLAGTKGGRFAVGALREEVKMQANTADFGLGTGAFFFGFGSALGKMNFLTKNRPALQRLSQRYLTKGPSGAMAIEADQLVHALADELSNDRDFSDTMDELYGDQDEMFKRIVSNTLMFQLTGVNARDNIVTDVFTRKGRSQYTGLFSGNKARYQAQAKLRSMSGLDNSLNGFKRNKDGSVDASGNNTLNEIWTNLSDKQRSEINNLPENLALPKLLEILDTGEGFSGSKKKEMNRLGRKLQSNREIYYGLSQRIAIQTQYDALDPWVIDKDTGLPKEDANGNRIIDPQFEQNLQAHLEGYFNQIRESGNFTDKDGNNSWKNPKIVIGKGDAWRAGKLEGDSTAARYEPNKDGGIIYLDLNKYQRGKVPHEIGHAIVDHYFKDNAVAKENFLKQVEKFASETANMTFNHSEGGEMTGKQLMDFISKNYSDKEGYSKKDRSEEYFTYMMELASDPMVQATNKYLTGKTYSTVMKMMGKIGKPLGLAKTNIKTGSEVLSTIYALNKGITSGKYNSSFNKQMRRLMDSNNKRLENVSALEEMQLADQGKSYEEAVAARIKKKKADKKSIDFDFTGDKTSEEITAENTKIVKGIQDRAREQGLTPYEVKSPEEIASLYLNNTRLPRQVLKQWEGKDMLDPIAREAFLESLDKQLYEYARRYGNTAYTKQRAGESKEAFEARKELISNLEIPFGAYAIEGLKKQVGNALVDAGVAYKEGNKIKLLQKVSGEASDKIFEGLVEKSRSATGKVLDFQEGRTDAQGNAKLDPITVVKDKAEAKEIVSKLDSDAEKINWEKENFSYKTTPDLSGVAKYFGVKESKINKSDGKINPKSTRLTQKEVESAQNKINEQAKEIFDSWANGYAESGKEGVRGYSTGIQNVLLKAVNAKGKALFYREGEFAQKTGPGLMGKEKLAFNEAGMKEFFGIMPDGKFQTLKENGKVDQRIKAAIHQLGKSITGKQFEKWLKENKPKGWQNYILDMSSGKGPERASKDLFEDRISKVKFTSKQKQVLRAMLDDKDFVDKNTLGELLLDDAFIDIGAIDRQRIIKGFKDAINDPTNITKVKEIIEKMDQKYFNEYVEALAENTGQSLEDSRIYAEKEINNYKKLYKELGVDYVAGVGRGPEINDKSINDYKKSIKSLLEGLDLDMLEAQNNTLLSSIISSITQGGTLKFGEYTGHGGKFKRGDSITKTRLIGSRTGSNAEFIRTLLEDSSFGKPKSKAKTKKYLKKAKYSFQPSYDAKGNKGHGERIAELYNKNPKKWLEEAQEYYAHKDAVKDFDTLQEAIDATYEANRYVYKEFYKSLLKLPNSASLLLSRLQTSASSGVPRGLVSMMSLTTNPKQKAGKSTELTHNEHALEMFNISKRFHEIKNSDLSMAQKRELIDLMAEGVAQHLIPKELQGIKDSKPYGGSTGRVSFNDILNTFVTEKSGQDQVFIAGEYAGMKVSEMIMKRYGKEIAKELIESIPVKDLNSEGWKLKQRVDNSKNYDKIIEDNFSEAKDYDVYAQKASKDLFEDPLNNMENRDIANRISLRRKNPIKKARVFDFDDTVARTNSKVFATKDGKKKTLTAEEFAKQGEKLTNEGWKMDFSDFNEVVEGKKGPLFEVMKKMKEAAGERDMFILTARAPESAAAIHRFLKEMGIDIPIENITGLGNSSGEAKAQWLVDKVTEGYNDFYFADDAPQNVKAVRDALESYDVKSQTQQAKNSLDLSTMFNNILQDKSGIEWYKEFSEAKAKVLGKDKFKFYIPYSAEDFQGLLYATLAKGKVGESQMAWYKQHLLDPYSRAQGNLSRDRMQLMSDFKALKKQLDVPKDLQKVTESGFTNEQAVRVYLYDKMGHEVPGLSKTDKVELIDIIESDGKLKAFGDQILNATKGDGYVKPGKNWLVGTITTDLIELINTTKRAKYLEHWQSNVNTIFSKANLNKLEAIFGPKYRSALENSLNRMKTGKNRIAGSNRLSNKILDYLNGSNAAIMFFNTRSAILQTISAANFVNWSFNNPLKAGQAFANQKQYWKDFSELFNSDYLVDRRNGLKININESEIADAAKTSKNKAKAILNLIKEKGYLPTQYADSFAIATGGATYFRNRIKDLMKNKNMTEADARKLAYTEFKDLSETSQQSSDPSKISEQQASDAGRLILMFANTPMQYARLQKRAIQDLKDGRGSSKEHVSKIIYYGFIQT